MVFALLLVQHSLFIYPLFTVCVMRWFMFIRFVCLLFTSPDLCFVGSLESWMRQKGSIPDMKLRYRFIPAPGRILAYIVFHRFIKGDIFYHLVWVCLAVTSRFQICLFCHHTWACPPRCVLDRSVYQPTQWTVANVAHLSVTHLIAPHLVACHGTFNYNIQMYYNKYRQ